VNEIDEIRWQMAQIRHDLHQDVSTVVSSVSGVVNEVTEVMDWRSTLRKHPYLLTGTALLAGFLLVPRRRRPVEREANHLEMVNGAAETPRKKRFRPLSWAFDLIGPIATQALQAYAMIWIENQLKQHSYTVPPESPGIGQQGQAPDKSQGNDFLFNVSRDHR
jgi:hypothetical protein